MVNKALESINSRTFTPRIFKQLYFLINKRVIIKQDKILTYQNVEFEEQ